MKTDFTDRSSILDLGRFVQRETIRILKRTEPTRKLLELGRWPAGRYNKRTEGQ
jgi:hypothetical protein